MKDEPILFKMIHSRKLLNKLPMNFITVYFFVYAKVLWQCVLKVMLT